MSVDDIESILFVAICSECTEDGAMVCVIGSARLFNPNAGDPTIADLHVAESWRGRRIGTSLMGSIIEWADDNDKDLYLHVRMNNSAMDWYQRLGLVGYETCDHDPLSVWMSRSQIDLLKQSIS